MLERALTPIAPISTIRRSASVLSVSTELPEDRLTSAELAAQLGITEEWILSRTGIRERRRARPDERLSDYATRAGVTALERAGVAAADLDLVIVATLTQDELTPNTAPLVADALGAHRAGTFDVGAACTSFLTGLAIGAAQIESGRAQRVLLVGADFVTRITDYTDKRTAPLFADAAGAVVLGEAHAGGGVIGPIVLGADGSHGKTIVAPHSDRLIRMDGPEVFRHAVNRMSEVTLSAVVPRRPDDGGHRPVRLPPGERADHQGSGGAARTAQRARGRLHRVARERVRRDATGGAVAGRARWSAQPGNPRAAQCVRRRLHVGRRRPRMGSGARWPMKPDWPRADLRW